MCFQRHNQKTHTWSVSRRIWWCILDKLFCYWGTNARRMLGVLLKEEEKKVRRDKKRIQGQTLYSKLFGEHSEVVIKWLAMIQGLWVQVVYVSAAVAIVIQSKLVKVWWQECTSCLYASFTDYSGCVSLRLLFLLYGLFSEVTKNLSLFSLRPSHEVQISAGSAETGLNKSSEQCRHSIHKHFETNASVLICSFFFSRLFISVAFIQAVWIKHNMSPLLAACLI